jgi:hypothetical protein
MTLTPICGAGSPWAPTLGGSCFLERSAYVMWRMYRYVPQARRRARKYGIDSKRFATSMRRTMPRNSSLIFQTAVGIVILILAL